MSDTRKFTIQFQVIVYDSKSGVYGGYPRALSVEVDAEDIDDAVAKVSEAVADLAEDY